MRRWSNSPNGRNNTVSRRDGMLRSYCLLIGEYFGNGFDESDCGDYSLLSAPCKNGRVEEDLIAHARNSDQM